MFVLGRSVIPSIHASVQLLRGKREVEALMREREREREK